MASPLSSHEPAGTNLLGDTLSESRSHFRQLVQFMEKLIECQKLEEARKHLPKLEALGKELHRLLSPKDSVDRRHRDQIDRDLERLESALRKGWGGAVGTGLLALIIGAVLGIAALGVIFWFAFT